MYILIISLATNWVNNNNDNGNNNDTKFKGIAKN